MKLISIKSLIFICTFCFLIIPTWAGQGDPKDIDNLYFKALQAYVEEGCRQSQNLPRDPYGIWRDYQHLLVVKEGWFQEPLPSKLGQQEVTFVTDQELIERHTKKKQKIPITYISPIQNHGSELTIHFREYWFSHKKQWRRHRFYIELEGGCKVTLKYNSVTDQFDISKVELWGI